MTGVDSACKWCGGAIAPTGSPLARPDWTRVRCGKCKSMYFEPMPSEDAVSAIYDEAWARDAESGAIGSTQVAAATRIAKRLVGDLQRDALILDYGAGTGELSKVLARQCAGRVVAYEPFGPGQEIEGVSWVSEADGGWSDLRYDCIFLSEVIEHLRDPVADLIRIRELLKPGGHVVVTTPNAAGVGASIRRGRWREADNPAHLNLFTEVSLSVCAREAGYAGFERAFFTVPYKKRLIPRLLLGTLQLGGLDGGLRGIMRKERN